MKLLKSEGLELPGPAVALHGLVLTARYQTETSRDFPQDPLQIFGTDTEDGIEFLIVLSSEFLKSKTW